MKQKRKSLINNRKSDENTHIIYTSSNHFTYEP